MSGGNDLPTAAFMALRERFFEEDGRPVPFKLRDKLNTQDDPLDEFLAQDVLAELDGIACSPAPGPLITPDLVLHRAEVDRSDDLHQIVGIEVKKVERTAQGAVARASGLDYNTTPPCGLIRVYGSDNEPMNIRGFYLFVCLETAPRTRSRVIISALALVDGNLLNEDFRLYLQVTGERSKRIGLGSFADGADRARPMMIFGNPLGVPDLDHAATMVHPTHTLSDRMPGLKRACVIRRAMPSGEHRDFSCYRDARDLRSNSARVVVDPFLTPTRDTKTRPRGRFVLPFTVAN